MCSRRRQQGAVKLDSTLSDAHLALGYVRAESFEWEGAEKEIRRAIDLDPTSAEPRYWLGYLLLNVHRHEEAVAVLRHAKAPNPLYFITSSYLGLAEMQTGAFTDESADTRRIGA